jgi:hypothetical protein
MRSPGFLSHRLPTPLRYLVLALVSVLVVCYYLGSSSPVLSVPTTEGFARRSHPIDELISKAEQDFDALVAAESTTLAESAAAYRKRRGRHPPPGFGEWFKFAQDHSVVIVEEFWDQIYHDLEPFWALPATQIRKDAWDFEMTINVRDHKATAGSNWFWTQIWLNLIRTIEHLLPDMDLALNAMDEPRIVVPWEDLAGYMGEAQRTRRIPDVEDVIAEFQNLPAAEEDPASGRGPTQKNWEETGAS